MFSIKNEITFWGNKLQQKNKFWEQHYQIIKFFTSAICS